MTIDMRLRVVGLAVQSVLILTGSVAHAACPFISLKSQVQYPTGQGPIQVVAADFTGDGVPDLASAGLSGVVTVLPGIAATDAMDFGFGGPIQTQVGGGLFGMATTDLNGDGRADLILADHENNELIVLLGTGDGHFAAPLAFPAGMNPYEVVVGDFNNDGVPDVAVADNGEDYIRVMIAGNDGTRHWDRTFAPAVAYATTNLPLSIAAGDFNGDGILDLVATEYTSGTVAVFFGNGSGRQGDGTFQPAVHIAAGTEPFDVAVADLNNDGNLDLVVANGSGAGVHVLLGTGFGSFGGGNTFLASVNCTGVGVADFDGDGIPDLVVTSATDNSLYLLKGSGSAGPGTVEFDPPTPVADASFPIHPIAVDLNLDGHPDVVSCDYGSSAVAVFLNLFNSCSANVPSPVITSVRDVPADQGGSVFITWTRSSLDVPSGAVNAYRVWRMIPPGPAAARALQAAAASSRGVRAEVVRRPDGATTIVYWEALATLPAQRLAGYGYTAPTPSDSMAGNPGFFSFMVSALTSDIDVFYDSPPDSGYSVDNLPPDMPAAFTVIRTAGANQLRWDPSPDADFANFVLYRSAVEPFTPSPGTLLATLTTPGYVDAGSADGDYQLAAVDRHGNTSPWTTAFVPSGTGVPGGPAAGTRLEPPSPNPVRGSLEVRFGLAHAGVASLALYDQQGRRVRTLVSGAQPAGDAVRTWDVRDDAGRVVRAGLYFIELRADGHAFVQRVTLVR